MKKRAGSYNSIIWIGSLFLDFQLTGCSQPPENGSEFPRAEISEEGTFAESSQLPFRIPLAELNSYEEIVTAGFCANGGERFGPTGK